MSATGESKSDVLAPSWATLRWYASQRSLRFTRALPFDEAKLTPGVLPAGGSSSAALHWSLLVVGTRASRWTRPLASWLTHAVDYAFLVPSAVDVSWSDRRARPRRARGSCWSSCWSRVHIEPPRALPPKSRKASRRSSLALCDVSAQPSMMQMAVFQRRCERLTATPGG